MFSRSIEVEAIVIGERHRALSDDACNRLAASMKQIGLRNPISVRIVDDYIDEDGVVCDGVPLLVAGRHRLEAAKRLGWSHIDCVEVEDDEIQAELWEIAENLHRLDLTKEQRDEHIRRYAELLDIRSVEVSPQNAAQPKSGPQGGRPKSIARIIADETGLSDDTIRRALKPSVPTVPNVPDAPADPLSAYYKWLGEINRVWGRAPAEWREMWLEQIDTPVFDRTRAA